VLSLSDQCVVDLKIAAGGRNWRCVAAEILEALAPVLSKDWRAYPRHLAGLLLGRLVPAQLLPAFDQAFHGLSA